MDSEQIAAKRLRRRRIAVRAVGVCLLVFSIAVCLLAVYVIGLMVTAPSGTYAAVDELAKFEFWHAIVVLPVLLAGSVSCPWSYSLSSWYVCERSSFRFRPNHDLDMDSDP